MARGRTLTCALYALAFTLGHNGGCHPDTGDPLPSPAHALAVILETNGVVEAELVLVSTATDEPTHIDHAEVSLSASNLTTALAPVAPGTYAALDPAALAYLPATRYGFSFELDDATARAHRAFPGRFEIAIHGGADRPDAWIASRDDGVEVAWSPGGLRVLIQAFDADGVKTYSTLDWDDPRIGAASWRTFPEGGAHLLPEAAWEGASPHRVRVCAVEVFRRDGEPDAPGSPASPQHALEGHGLSTGLGWLSGGVAGRCVWVDI